MFSREDAARDTTPTTFNLCIAGRPCSRCSGSHGLHPWFCRGPLSAIVQGCSPCCTLPCCFFLCSRPLGRSVAWHTQWHCHFWRCPLLPHFTFNLSWPPCLLSPGCSGRQASAHPTAKGRAASTRGLFVLEKNLSVCVCVCVSVVRVHLLFSTSLSVVAACARVL